MSVYQSWSGYADDFPILPGIELQLLRQQTVSLLTGLPINAKLVTELQPIIHEH